MSDTDRHHVISFTGDTPSDTLARALRDGLSDYPGSWRVHLDQKLVGGWWLVRLSTEGFQHELLVSPDEQNPERLMQSLKDILGRRTSGSK